jgi:hypothetical protein
MSATGTQTTKTITGPLLRLPDGQSQEIEPDRLLLDPQNLRLLERADSSIMEMPVKLIGQPSVQDKLFDLISGEKVFDIESLSASIIHNSFLKHERLIVCKYDGDRLVVLEGNRRLTAVRNLFKKYGPRLDQLPDYVKQSLRTLPCFVLDGPPVSGDQNVLDGYRRAAEIYIGMRHLMGAKNWEPASRYEFQARLIFDEKWKPEEVAERFGRQKSDVLRDLKAQVLYHDFRKFENKNKVEHSLTYNAFAEAARAPVVMKWLGWSNAKMKYLQHDNEESFFHYLLSRMRLRSNVRHPEGEEESPQESAELVVRRLRDILKLDDDSINAALLDRAFDDADIIYEQIKEGSFSKRIASYIRAMKRVTSDDLIHNAKENGIRLRELAEQVEITLTMLNALTKKK